MPQYKLTYFNTTGRAEPCRILLALAGVDWEDDRIEYADFPAVKEKTVGTWPYGQIPILECHGKVIGQSMAIFRYLAREHGFLPATNLQVAIADSIVDQAQDCLDKMIQAYVMEKDPAKKEELTKDLKENIVPKNMKFFQKILKENNEGKTFFFGEKITYADVRFFVLCNNLDKGNLRVPNFLKENFPDLAKLFKAVMDEPAISAYLKKRPVTDA